MTTMNDDATMAADAQLHADLVAIFEPLASRLLPEGDVAEIYSSGYAEDGETFLLNVILADGADLFISVCPGRPITCCVVN